MDFIAAAPAQLIHIIYLFARVGPPKPVYA